MQLPIGGLRTYTDGVVRYPSLGNVQLVFLDFFGSKLWAKQPQANIVNLTQGSKLVREYAAEIELSTGVGSTPQMTPP